ncbi:MAG: helix-turn-helix transcriptional regulator [Clostridia bacterium]|nr:helix-turn-helix transcriptional regulator [Clostridia bacterium]
MQGSDFAIPLSRQAGDFLRRQLAERGYTQERFADEFGVSERQVRRWESQGINSLDTLSQLLIFFGCGIGDIFSPGEDIPGVFFARPDVLRPCPRLFSAV